MKIKQILNNNVAVVKKGGHEVIVVSKGVGFSYKKGQEIKEDVIDRMYILDSYDMLDRFSYLLSKTAPEDILIIEDIIKLGEERLGHKVPEYLSLTLLDHLEYLMERAEKGQYIFSPLTWDVKRFYPKEYELGLEALSIIGEKKQLTIPEDEAVSIALHFVNIFGEPNESNMKSAEVEIVSDIISIVKLHFKMVLDEQSVNYLRFANHLQYFVQRLLRSESHKDNTDSKVLLDQVTTLYPEAFKCVQKVKSYVTSRFDTNLTINEECYLILHVNRVTSRMEEK